MKFAVFLFRRKEGGILVTDFMLVRNTFVLLLLLLLLLTLHQIKGSELTFATLISDIVSQVKRYLRALNHAAHHVFHLTPRR